MRRVVVTGMGIVSCLGNDPDSVAAALAEGRSGIRAMPDYPTMGLRSHIAGVPQIVVADHLDRRDLRFMGDAAPRHSPRSRWRAPSKRAGSPRSRSATPAPA